MKKVLILSDTHAHFDAGMEKYARNVDEIWHAGDIGSLEVLQKLQSCAPVVRAVYGNVDSQEIRVLTHKILTFESEDVRVLITHICGYPPKYMPDVVKEIAKYQPTIVVGGHSHILKVMPDTKRNLLYINPGAIGSQGFHSVRTMLLLTLHAGKAQSMQVIEYERK
ncbi:MAG: metallophosphatase family protein [Bacteroidales bacterium]|nr:metallophosphatase family protein [Bacteroidales bacterium]